MIVRDNAGGRRTVRYFGSTHNKVSKTLEKLSSGYRINRAGDDAAGLAVSEKMRARITGMTRARLNSLDGSRLIQTGEGALDEVHAMLDRASYLAAQSANGVYEDAVDRENLQEELEHLCSEIDRITKTANFNTIELFQDKGVEWERTTIDPSAVKFQQKVEDLRNLNAGKTGSSSTSTSPLATPDDGTKKVLKIEYFEHDVKTTQTPGGGSSLVNDKMLPDGTTKLSDVLKDQIIPNTVQNILTQYGSAFQYLTGSTIGIGLEYFSQGASGGTTTLAYVRGQVGSGGMVNGQGELVSREDYITYTLGVNINAIDASTPEKWAESRRDLEATIAHEMIHAFMDEAATAGMFGKVSVNNKNLTQAVEKFPDWFIEGMAQTASGPDNWVKNMGLSKDHTPPYISDEIKTAIGRNTLGSGTTASQYGTGYLACMYLGSVIAGNGTPATTVDAATIAGGLSTLMNKIVNGTSLDKAISELTKNKFSGIADFQSQFNSGTADGLGDFVTNLLTATGNGRGGVVSGDLTATDLTADTTVSSDLFQLTTNSTEVKNVYPDGYNVYSGGAAKVDGTKPDDKVSLPYIDFKNIRIYGVSQESDIEFKSDGTLTVKAGAGIKITVRQNNDPPDSGSTHKTDSVSNIILGENISSATLSGVKLTGDLTVKSNAEITYDSDNEFGKIKLEGNTTFDGTGGLKASTFDADNHNVSFKGGAVVVGDTAGISNPGTVTVEGTAIAVASLAPPAGKAAVDIPWSGGTQNLSGLGKITSIQIDGTKYDMSLDQNQAAKLWLDNTKSHRITFTDENGVSKTLTAARQTKTDPADPTQTVFDKFEWNPPARPYAVTGGVEGKDWEYGGDDGNTLIIKTATSLKIGAGASVDENGNTLTGRIKLSDGITGTVDLTLDGVSSVVKTGKAFDLGKNNTVTLKLSDDKTSTFTSGSGYAGISIGEGTSLSIDRDTSTTGTDRGKLEATGGQGGAGIGRDESDYNSPLTDSASSISIDGVDITATGGEGGAGIGGALYAAIGNITIGAHTGTIVAKSKGHGAGIGGGWTKWANNGDITIQGGEITASSPMHGTGIGAGCQGTSGKITITGSTVIKEAQGGDDGAGIGASWLGTCGEIEISGDASIERAHGGNNGAGIGAGSDKSNAGNIKIDTTDRVNAEGGRNGVGIGSGYQNSSCGNIEIVQGVVDAKGSTDSTGIGAGRDSISGNISIGDPNGKKNVVVNADGGMSNDGGNIMSYKDRDHKTPGTVTIVGGNTSVRPGEAGEGKYSTSGVPANPANTKPIGDLKDEEKLFSYPVYLFKTDPPPEVAELKDPSKTFPLPLPDGATDIKIKAVSASNKTVEWETNLSHDPFNKKFAYIWMTGEKQTVTVSYKDTSGTSGEKTLNLVFFPEAGKFRIKEEPHEQNEPPKAKEPEYITKPQQPGDPVKPADPTPAPPKGHGGIILQIGADFSEILEVPRFYLSARSLGLDGVNISTQDRALKSMPVLKNAINRVSSIRGEYGALQNRLEHNQNDLSVATENLTDAESRIRDADMAEEHTQFVKLTILQQSAQAMVAQSNQNASRVMQLFQQ